VEVKMNTWNNFDVELMQEGVQELVCRDCGTRFEVDLITGHNTISVWLEDNNVLVPVCPECGAEG
jgi:hypothetical protein